MDIDDMSWHSYPNVFALRPHMLLGLQSKLPSAV